ncbi:unnamed protein product, partial [Rotaria magnacalcarata]
VKQCHSHYFWYALSIIWHGDLFRLVSPYRHEHDTASLMYASENQGKALWFTYLISNRYCAGSNGVVRLKGLDLMVDTRRPNVVLELTAHI